MNKFESAYKLESENGVRAFLSDYPNLREARYYATNLDMTDMLLDFDLALTKSLTDRQHDVVRLHFIEDMKQSDVAEFMGISQQTVQEHIRKAIRNLATYHMLEKKRGDD